MSRKLYGKNIPPQCEYCMIGEASSDGEVVFCAKKGIVPNSYSCRKFKYDPLRRKPKVSPALEEYSMEDFML